MDNGVKAAGPQGGADAVELQELRDSARKFATANKDRNKLRSQRREGAGYDQAHARQMAELGWLGIMVPEDAGGLGLGVREMAVVAEELGKALLGEPLVSCAVMAAGLLARSDNETLKAQLLGKLLAGKLVPTVAWQEEGGSLDPAHVAATAVAGPSGIQIKAEKKFVPGASSADGFIVLAKLDGSPVLVWLGRNTTGVKTDAGWRIDGTAGGSVSIDAQVPRENILMSGNALSAMRTVIVDATVVAAAELLGVMTACLETTLEYLRTRQQFGKPIGSFQALQHRGVDMFIQKELTSAVLDEVVALFRASGTDYTRIAAASRLKARASQAAIHIARESVQMHGAMGFTDDCDIGLYLKRSMVLAAWLGNARTQRKRYVDDGMSILSAQ